jgi:hypothetical protein
MMDISISVLGLTGIMMQDKGRKKRSKKSKKKSTIGETPSTSYSTEDEDAFPVKAVASFFKKVNSNQTAIASHLPSMTIRPISNDGDDDGKNRFNATWPTDFDPLGNELSTFKCSRMMQIEDEGQYKIKKQYRPSHTPLMIPERLQLTIGLTRGSEMLSIGSATVVVTGEEAQDVQVNLPISLEKKEKDDGNTSKKAKKKTGKPIKPVAFEKELQKKYSLHSNACLKLLLRVNPVEPTLKTSSNPTMSNDPIPEMMAISVSSGSDINRNMSRESDDNVSQYPPTFEPQSQNYGQQGNDDYRYPDYSYGTGPREEVSRVSYGFNDDDTEDGTIGTTDGTVMTSDTHSTLSRFANAFTCAGIMCVPVSQTSKEKNNSDKENKSRNSLQVPGMLSTLSRFHCDSTNHLASIDDVSVNSYREYKNAMSRHKPNRKSSSKGKSIKSKSPYSTQSNDDCSAATEKVENLAWSSNHYADRMI